MPSVEVGFTPLQIALYQSDFMLADQLIAQDASLPAIECCLGLSKPGPSGNNHTRKMTASITYEFTRCGEKQITTQTTSNLLEEIVKEQELLYVLLKKKPFLIRFIDEQGRTLLHYACERVLFDGRQEFSTTLSILLHQDNLNLNDYRSYSALHFAAHHCDSSDMYRYGLPKLLRKALRTHHALDQPDNQGYNLLHLACVSCQDHQDRFEHIVNMIMTNYPCFDINARNKYNETVFLLAVKLGYSDALYTLLNYNANPHVSNNDGTTPVMCIDQQVNQITSSLLQKNLIMDKSTEHLEGSWINQHMEKQQLKHEVSYLFYLKELRNDLMRITGYCETLGVMGGLFSQFKQPAIGPMEAEEEARLQQVGETYCHLLN